MGQIFLPVYFTNGESKIILGDTQGNIVGGKAKILGTVILA